QRHACRARDRAADRGAIESRVLQVAGSTGTRSVGQLAARCPMASRSLGHDRGNEWTPIILGAGASAGQGGLSSIQLLCARIPSNVAEMKFGIDRLVAEPALRAPLKGRRVALLAHPASVTEDLTHALDALAACADVRITAAFGPQ